ncbi:MAG: hypothetical protein ACXVJO_16930, partial [Thermoanaerobaculia bacterium]
DALSKCLVTSTSSADKTALVRWMFATMSLHPDVQALSSVTAVQRAEINKNTARLFERLLTDSCASETKEAVKYEGPSTIESAFSVLGQVATREMFTNPKVAAGLEELGKNFDEEKLKKVFEVPKEK